MLAHLQQLFDNTSLGFFWLSESVGIFGILKKVFKIQMDILILAAAELLSESSNLLKCQLHWTVLSQDSNISAQVLLVRISKKVWTSESYIWEVPFITCEKWIGKHVFPPRTDELWTHAGVQALHRRSHEHLCQLLPVRCLQPGQLVSHLFCHLKWNIDWRRPKFLGSCIPPISCSISQLCFSVF